MVNKNNYNRDIVFISTKSADEEKCRELCSKLDNAGLKYWSMFNNNINLEENNWQKNINIALRRAIILIVLISENSIQKGSNKLVIEMRNELDTFKKFKENDKDLQIIPIKLYENEYLVVQRGQGNEVELTINDIITEILGISAETKMRQFNDVELIKYIVKYIINYRDSFILKYNKLLNLQNYCIQKKCLSKKVSDYILTSRELSQEKNNTELHIITNEFWHYDFTSLATLAIAENIRKYNVKYIYYYPETCIEDFNTLKTRVKNYLLRNESAVVEFDKWLRVRINECYGLSDFLKKDFYGASVSYIVGCFEFDTENTQKEFEKIIKKFPNIRRGTINLCSVVLDFLNGNNPTSFNVNILIDEMNRFKEIINLIENYKSEIRFNDLLATLIEQKFKYIIDLFDFYQWFTKDIENDNFNSILDRLLNDENIKYISETREWITEGNGSSSGARALNEESPELDEIIERNLIGVLIPDDIPIYMCNSFCLYVTAVNELAVAWYACDSAVDSNTSDTDENIFVFAPEDGNIQDIKRFKDAYYHLICSIPNAINILKEKECYIIIELLFKKEGK